MWSPDHWKHETITCDVWSKLQTWMPNISGRLCLLLVWAKVSALRIRQHHSYSIPSIYHSSGLSPAYLNQFSCWLDASTIAPRWNNPISFAVSWGPSLTRCSSLGDTTCHCANKGISPPDLTIFEWLSKLCRIFKHVEGNSSGIFPRENFPLGSDILHTSYKHGKCKDPVGTLEVEETSMSTASWVLVKDSDDPVATPRKRSWLTDRSEDVELLNGSSLSPISPSSCCFSRSCWKARGLYACLGRGSKNWDTNSGTGVGCWSGGFFTKGLYTDKDRNWGSNGSRSTGFEAVSCVFSCWSATIACSFPNTTWDLWNSSKTKFSFATLHKLMNDWF